MRAKYEQAKQAIAQGGFTLVQREWRALFFDYLGRTENVLVEAMFSGRKINGQLCGDRKLFHSYAGQVAQFVRRAVWARTPRPASSFGAEAAPLTPCAGADVPGRACQPQGDHRAWTPLEPASPNARLQPDAFNACRCATPHSCAAQDDIPPLHGPKETLSTRFEDETCFRYRLGPKIKTDCAAYNSYFDDTGVDLLLLPAARSATPDVADCYALTIPMTYVECDGATRVERNGGMSDVWAAHMSASAACPPISRRL